MAKQREKPDTKTKRKAVSKKQLSLGAIGTAFPFGNFMRYKKRGKSNTHLIKKAARTSAKEKEGTLPPKEKPRPREDRKTPPKVNYDDLVIQEMAMGHPDGTQTTRHSKVSISFTCFTLKGVRFADGKHQFRLGSGQAIPGLERGVKGMRVGDRRRLLIPTSCRVGGPVPPWQEPIDCTTRTIVCVVTLNNVKNQIIC